MRGYSQRDDLAFRGAAERSADPGQGGGELGPVPLQLIQDGPGFPDEDPRVPGKVAGGDETLGGGAVGLLAELDHAVHGDSLAGLQQLAALDVAIAGLGAGRLDTKGDQGRGIVLDDRRRGLNRGQKDCGRLDDVVGGHDDHGAMGIFLADDPGGQANASGCVARAGLGDDVFGGQLGKLGVGGFRLVGTGDDHDPLPGDQGLDPGHGLLEHRRVAKEPEELLGSIAAALGPEPRAASSRHDDRVQHETSWFWFSLAGGAGFLPDPALSLPASFWNSPWSHHHQRK